MHLSQISDCFSTDRHFMSSICFDDFFFQAFSDRCVCKSGTQIACARDRPERCVCEKSRAEVIQQPHRPAAPCDCPAAGPE
jgi:hypothetical protein